MGKKQMSISSTYNNHFFFPGIDGMLRSGICQRFVGDIEEASE